MVGAAVTGLFAVAVNDRAGPLSRPEFHFLTTLPLAVYPVGALALLVPVLVRNHWWLGLGLFFGWIPFEDLVRKFANNDLRVYFVKDALLAIAVLGALPHLRGLWRRSLGEAWLPTIALFSVAIIMCAPAATSGFSAPIAALHTRFLFALLLPIGAVVARDRRLLENTLLGLSAVAVVVCIFGVVQAVIGPAFLNPSLAPSALHHLTVERTEGAEAVLRPSGPFTDVSRFASFTITSIALALAAQKLASTRIRRGFATAAVVIGCVAAFASGSRASLLIAVVLVGMTTARYSRRRGQELLRLILGAVLLGVVAASIGGRAGDMLRGTSNFFNATMNPWSSKFEVGHRVVEYADAIFKTVAGNNRLGRGTGAETLANQYVSNTFAIRDTESGWRSVASEWGTTGFIVWVAWTAAWLRRAFRPADDESSPVEPARFVIALYLALFLLAEFSLSIGAFENYAANIFFWFLSGILFSRPAAGLDTSHDNASSSTPHPRTGPENAKKLPSLLSGATLEI